MPYSQVESESHAKLYGDTPPDFPPPDPRRVTVLDALKRGGWLIVVLFTLIGTGAAVAVVQQMDRPYYAETQLTVAAPDLQQPGALTGFTDAAGSLASSYSRSVRADGVVSRAARSTEDTPADVRDRVSATPVPDSPIFRITASGETPSAAAGLANASTSALVHYVRTSASGGGAADELLRRYRKASGRVSSLSLTVDRLGQEFQLSRTPENRVRLEKARGELDVARLRASTLRQSYQQGGAAESSSLVNVQTRAEAADAWRDKAWQKYLFAGFVGGLLVGVALATLRAQGRARRYALG